MNGYASHRRHLTQLGPTRPTNQPSRANKPTKWSARPSRRCSAVLEAPSWFTRRFPVRSERRSPRERERAYRVSSDGAAARAAEVSGPCHSPPSFRSLPAALLPGLALGGDRGGVHDLDLLHVGDGPSAECGHRLAERP